MAGISLQLELQIETNIFLYNTKMDEENSKIDLVKSLPRRIRGKHAGSFRTFKVQTNYYSVSVANSISEIYIYKVVYNPKVQNDNTRLRMNLLQKILGELKQFIPSPVISGNNIYSLKPPTQKEKQFKVDEYSILVKQVKVYSVAENTKSLLQFLNIGLRNLFHRLDYTEIGKTGKFFQVKKFQEIDRDLRMFSGYKANFMRLQGGIYLRVDGAKKIVRNQTVLDYINEVYNLNKSKEREEKRAILKTELIGQTIMTNYGKARYVRISDVIFETVDEKKLNNSDITLRQFYEQKYGKKVNHPKQPLLEIQENRRKKDNESEKSIFIPEFCSMTGIPDSFDEFKRKKISQSTIRPAHQKKKDIENFMRKVDQVQDFSSLKELGISLNNRMTTLDAKIVPTPKLELGSNKSVEKGREAGFQLFRDPIFSNRNSIRCGIFCQQNVDVRGAANTFTSTSRNLGVKFQYDVITIHEQDRRRIVDQFSKRIQDSVRKDGINMCLIVIPNFLKHSYPEIKKSCLSDIGIVSQCVVESTLKKKNLQSIATKLLLQMIAKIGNVLWVPKVNTDTKGFMIIAFDTAKANGKNIISCVATSNQSFSNFYAKSSTYTDNSDKFNQMVKLSLQGINHCVKKSSAYLREILVLHNSCTEDQARLFLDFYLDGLKGRMKDTCQTMPCISLVMVNTKTSERFFSSDNRGVSNPQAGTLISESIVSENYDFYLVSQFSNRGCTVPNHYKVIYSDSKLEEGVLQEIIFSQCFNYVNWTGSIKIPGPLQYAKKLAKFAGEALGGQEVQEDMSSKLYFV